MNKELIKFTSSCFHCRDELSVNVFYFLPLLSLLYAFCNTVTFTVMQIKLVVVVCNFPQFPFDWGWGRRLSRLLILKRKV